VSVRRYCKSEEEERERKERRGGSGISLGGRSAKINYVGKLFPPLTKPRSVMSFVSLSPSCLSERKSNCCATRSSFRNEESRRSQLLPNRESSKIDFSIVNVSFDDLSLNSRGNRSELSI